MRSFIVFSMLVGISLALAGIPQGPVTAMPVGQCQSGKAAARLTGWELNNKMPRGTASYTAEPATLEVSVENVALPDGRKLSLLIGEEQVGELQPLKDGAATSSFSRKLAEGDRVRIFDGERPIVSGNLKCQQGETAKNTGKP